MKSTKEKKQQQEIVENDNLNKAQHKIKELLGE